MNQNKLLLIVVVIAFTAIGLLYYRINSLSKESSKVKTFNLVLKNYQYQPSTIKVNLNDEVVLNVDNQDNVEHGLHLPTYNIIESVPSLQKKQVRFVATKTGTEVGVCSSDHGERLNVEVL